MPFFFFRKFKNFIRLYIIMQIFFPNNIFSRLVVGSLPAALQASVVYQPSSLLTSKLNEAPDAAALIPTLDIIKNKDLYISKLFGLSFEGTLSNSYLYYASGKKEITSINLFGDVSSVEVILTKILFKELYDADIKVGILSDESKIKGNSVVITGDKNFEANLFATGISFAEEIADTFNMPFVNYVLAAKEKSLIEKLNTDLAGISGIIYDSIESNTIKEKLNEDTLIYLRENISSLIMNFDEQDIEAINQLLRLPYFHGLIDDIVEVNFV